VQRKQGAVEHPVDFDDHFTPRRDSVPSLPAGSQVFGFYNGSTIWPVQREYYKPTIGAGVRWNPSLERP
jgi:hypothetical protein